MSDSKFLDHPIGFHTIDGEIQVDGVKLSALATQFGTPAYIYSAGLMQEAYQKFQSDIIARLPATTLPLTCFAVKANPNLSVIRLFAEMGAGADIVSGGELQRALRAGIQPEKIVFAGVGKRDDEMAVALEHGILQFNVESSEELHRLARLAQSKGVTARAAIRVNPDVDGGTHAKISTGNKYNKFGIEWEQVAAIFADARAFSHLQLDALSMHIGSQLTDIAPLDRAFANLRSLVMQLRGAGHTITRLDLGGGIGVAYRGKKLIDLGDYASIVNKNVGDLGCRLIFEPGRFLVAKAGILLSRVIANKANSSRHFVIIDAAMNDLIRPALYKAYHKIMPVIAAAPDTPLSPVDIVGPVCESSDIFAKQRPLPPLKAGDLVMIADSGAYGAAMSSSYNSRTLPCEIMVRNGQSNIIRRPITTEDLLRFE